jgi:hypothetical protein
MPADVPTRITVSADEALDAIPTMARPKPAADLTHALLVRQLRRRVKGDTRAEELLDELRDRLYVAAIVDTLRSVPDREPIKGGDDA